MHSLVVDASAALSLILDDEGREVGEAFVLSLIDFDPIAPSLFWYEVRNALVVNERRGRHTAEDTEAFLSALRELAIEIEPRQSSLHVLALARKHGLSVYDAAYLSLAVESMAKIASLDNKLIAAARAEGVEIIEHLASAA